MKSLICAVTGANGYVGKQIVLFLRRNNFIVYELARSIERVQNPDFFIPFSLDNPRLVDMNHIDILIHCAYDFSPTTLNDSKKINLDGSLTLLQHAKLNGVKKIIVLSTLSSFETTRSTYGKTKLALEKSAQALGAIILRPGLIFGKQTTSIVGAMKKFVKQFPVVPLIGNGNQPFYACYINDLCQLILDLILTDNTYDKPIFCANPNPITFRELVKTLAATENKKVMLLPIPFLFIWTGLRLLETMGFPIGLRSDSVIGAHFYDKQFNLSHFTVLESVPFRSMDSNLL